MWFSPSEGCRAALSDTTDASPLKFQNNVLRARPYVQPIGPQLFVTSSRPVIICPLPHRFLLQRRKVKFQKTTISHATSTWSLSKKAQSNTVLTMCSFFQLNILISWKYNNFNSYAGGCCTFFLYFLNSLYFKTCSLVQQFHKQSLMSQMEHCWQ